MFRYERMKTGRYRQFWQMSLSNLKSFVEQEYARELGEGPGKTSSRRK